MQLAKAHYCRHLDGAGGVIADQGGSRGWQTARNTVTFAHGSRDARDAEIQRREKHCATKILRLDILHGQFFKK